jgi:two-component system, chemotaxis family, CheB/CheR fusion protein
VKKRPSRQRKTEASSSSPSTSVQKTSTPEKVFPVVGVGASAGGLEAFSSLLAHLPDSTSMAFVLVQHLDPSHTSALEEILSRTTKIPVTEVKHDELVQPNRVYVIPANADMIISKGRLRLSARSLHRGQHRPIDNFFRSLAEDLGDHAIGVILSGTASDGTAGCGTIKSVGGITFAQDETAKYNSMPRSAIDAGCVDFVLPPQGIAAELVRIEKHPYVARAVANPDVPLPLGSKSAFNALFSLLHRAKDVDFTNYKQSTLQRRIKRRMVLNRIDTIERYVQFATENPAELEELYRDILIHVTQFFRDPGSFDAVRKYIFPNLLAKRRPTSPVRIWVPGCSTGEEAYSLAISSIEYFWDNGNHAASTAVPPVQIFATDISDAALDRARAGVYPESTVLDLSPALLKRFFVQLDGGYQVSKSVREMCIFARQNVVKDPPFSNLDFISCRNLLIYLGPELQKRVIPAFHYALRALGYLMVGTAESLGSFSDHFNLIEKKHRIYQKKHASPRLITYFTGVDQSRRRGADPKAAARPPVDSLTIEKEVERVLVNRFVPASIVVNSEMDIVQFRGKTGAYLEPPTGQPNFSLSKMAREGLLVDLRAALGKAQKENVVVRKERVSIQSNGGYRLIDLEVIPVQGHDSHRFFVVVFQESAKEPLLRPAKPRKLSPKDAAISRQNDRLQREIRQLRDQLQSLIEDHETTSEEFKTANEEVLSANEELQSTNEELETAKEELQSSNEELTTLNEELQNRNVELTTTNNDLVNFLGNVNIAVVMVANDSRIRRFTPAAQKLLNLLPGDIGRRLGEIRGNVNGELLGQLVRETIESISPREQDLQDSAGVWYTLCVRPYKTWDNRIDGAVISFQDVDAIKRVLDATTAYADTLIETAREAILVLDARLRVVVANPAFYKAFQVVAAETVGQFVFDLGNRQWDIPALRQVLERIITLSARVDDFEVRHDFPHLGQRTMLLNARRIEPRRGEFLILLTIEDVTEKHAQDNALKRQAALLELARDTIMIRSLDGRIRFWNRGAEEVYGWNKEEVLGKLIHELLRTEYPVPLSQIREQLLSRHHWEGELKHFDRDGQPHIVNSRWALLEHDGSEPVILETNSDVSALKHSEDALRRLSSYLMTLQDEERRRIARELHDSTGQKLAAAKLQLDTLVKSGNLKSHEKIIKETSQWIDDCFQEVRTLSQLLHPPLLDEAGLLSATRWMVDGFSDRAKIPVDLKVAGEVGRLPQPVELALFRVIQESLSNIHRHSGASKAQIKLARSDGSISLEIRDNGKGIPPELLSNSRNAKQVVGVGILGMRERLSQLGGTLQIESDKSGTTVRVQVPLAAASSG